MERNNIKVEKLKMLIRSIGVAVFEYFPKEDRLILYDNELKEKKVVEGFLAYIKEEKRIHPEDKWLVKEFLQGRMRGPVEIRIIEDPKYKKLYLDAAVPEAAEPVMPESVVGILKDVSEERKREEILVEQAQKDSMTGLYNNSTGKMLISEYLMKKDPYASCGLLVLDIDYFKNINDTYGHLFGDEVLISFSSFLKTFFVKKDILMRAGGDEFVILLKDISQAALAKKTMRLVESISKMEFREKDFHITCSVGVCYLPENVAGYTYEQLFENADWALYKAKTSGRNRYMFCDNLKRFEVEPIESMQEDAEIDGRYLRNDIVATAFEIFEKMNSFDAAVELLLKVIGIRFRLDRISIIDTDVGRHRVGRQYQWCAPGVQAVLPKSAGFTQDDFLTLFRSYDEYGTTVLQYDNMGMYSPAGANLLVQGGARTVVYAAMYCEGKYVGAIAYNVCTDKRYWSKQDRKQLGELAKIISAHLSKSKALNASNVGIFSIPDYDALTGLISFDRFKEEVERQIVGGYAVRHMMVYTDFSDFKYFNQKYSYRVGDQLLKEFANFITEILEQSGTPDTYFTRVTADQFLLYMPYDGEDIVTQRVERVNRQFIKEVSGHYNGTRIKIRTGIYPIEENCSGVSAAIDAANYARKQIQNTSKSMAVIYDDAMRKRQHLENEIMNSIDTALEQEQFHVYYQPKISLKDYQIIGAEALVRWIRPDGTILSPDFFVPLYEQNGRIVDLDYYMFEHVVRFIRENLDQGREMVPISVNASALHVLDEQVLDKYLEILKHYKVDPSYIEIELTETETARQYENIKDLFTSIRAAGISTSLDDFGAGYSLLNAIIDIPFDVIKLDRIFIEKCQKNERGICFLEQLVHTLKKLDVFIVCEGVETDEQMEILKQTECDAVQGNWFSRPVPEQEFEKLLYE